MNTPNQCGECIYYNAPHQCCAIRIERREGISSYLHREPISQACGDFNVPDLPEFVQNKAQSHQREV